MSVTELLLLVLATWRATLMIVDEDGPGGIFRRWRKLVRAGEFNPALVVPDRLGADEYAAVMAQAHVPIGFWGKLCSCPYCTSVWLAVLTYCAWLVPWLQWLVCIGAIAGAVALVIRIIDVLQRLSDPPAAG